MKHLIWLLSLTAFGQHISIPTHCVDNSRNCSNTSETVLTPTNIVTGNFRQLGTFAVDGQVYAQPLIAAGVTVGGVTIDVLIVATMHGTLYAFNANAPNTAPLWSRHLSDPRTTFEAPRGGADFYDAEMGCMSTPVIDTAAGFVYAVCAGPGNATIDASWAIYKVSLTAGTVSSSATVAGTSGSATFAAYHQMQRPALTLANSKVYVGFGSYADQTPWYGWLFAFATSNLAVTNINFAPTSTLAGIWGGGGGPAVDASGNLYVMLGNGGGALNPPTDFTESVVKVDGNLNVLDWFTVSDWSSRDGDDSDLGSSWAMLLGTTHVMFSGKRNDCFMVLQSDMGHLQGGGGTAPQVCTKYQNTGLGPFTNGPNTGTFGGSTFMNGRIYWSLKGLNVGLAANKLHMFALTGTTLPSTPTAISATNYLCCGAQQFGSANGSSNGIIWALTPDVSIFSAEGTGTLRAFDPVTLAEIYTGPSVGNVPKWQHPVVANGKVYVATLDGSVQAYGLCTACGTTRTGRTSSVGRAGQ